MLDICFVRDSFEACNFRLVSNSLQMAANWIAKKSLGSFLPPGWPFESQYELMALLCQDISS